MGNEVVLMMHDNGKDLEIFEDKLKITPTGIWGIAGGGKTIPFSSLTAIEFKEAGGLIPGYLQFSLVGGRESVGGFLTAAEDENSFMFLKGNNEQAIKIKDYIEDKLQSLRNPSPSKSSNSADEIAKLFDLKEKGIITDEDFQKGKNKILGL
jgi:hypothetical protein